MRPQRTRAVHRGQESGLLSFRIRARVPSGSRSHLVSCTAGVRAAWAPRERFSVQVCLVSVLCARYRYRRRITYARTSECRSALFFMLARAHMQPAAHGDHTADAETRASRDTARDAGKRWSASPTRDICLWVPSALWGVRGARRVTPHASRLTRDHGARRARARGGEYTRCTVSR